MSKGPRRDPPSGEVAPKKKGARKIKADALTVNSGFHVPPPLPEEDEPTPTIDSARVYENSAFDATQDQDLKDLVDQESRARKPSLTVVAGKQMGQTFLLPPGTTSIGRAPGANFLVDESGVSRRHADIIVLPEEQVILKDRNSTNGTLVNGDVVKNEARALKDGDKIQVGSSFLLRFSYQDKLDTSLQQRLYDSAVRDALTGMYNKRYLDERVEQEWAAHLRYGTHLSLLMLDIDHFKRINDTLGHSAGDRVLKGVAHRIQRSLRKEEVFARYGGEEFVVLLRESTLESAQQCAERMRQLVEMSPFPSEDESVRVTISLGVASTAALGTDSAKNLLARADQHLYRAKQSGRNRWVSDDEPTGLPGDRKAPDADVQKNDQDGE
jgi:two-component system, cell cycle response regulator